MSSKSRREVLERAREKYRYRWKEGRGRKNDNARVEQKNRTHVRELIGYGRLEGAEVAKALNELYAKEWGWFRNFFCPA